MLPGSSKYTYRNEPCPLSQEVVNGPGASPVQPQELESLQAPVLVALKLLEIALEPQSVCSVDAELLSQIS